ncbi:MAG: hypothetical protein HFH03_10155 [Dorea sp.]|nr:hypothetical protein [Dorea sp.]
MREHITPKERQRIRNRRRRQEVKRQLYLCGVLAILLVALVVTYNSKAAEKKKVTAAAEAAKKQQKEQKEQTEQKEQVSAEAAKQMEEASIGTVADNETFKERVRRVKEEARQSGYPKDITDLLEKNEETIDFVENFVENKNNPPAEVVSEDLKKGEIPQLLQWDERWGHVSYGTGFIASCGCGPTAMAMVISGLTGDVSVTPVVVARYSEKKGYIDENNNTYWELMSNGGKRWGITCLGGDISEDFVARQLQAGHPIICSMGPGDFTDKGHFIVLTKYKNGKVKVNDPFSQKNSDKLWKYSKIKDQIKSLWVYKMD